MQAADYLFVKENVVKKTLESNIGKVGVFVTAVAHVPKNPIDGFHHVADLIEHPIRADFACGPDNNQAFKVMAKATIALTKDYAMHKCCVKHDNCYSELGKTQAMCDDPFCVCMKGATGSSECAATGDSFCSLVKTWGDSAFDAAQKIKSEVEKEATTAATADQKKPGDTDTCFPSHTRTLELRLMPQCQDYRTEIDNCCYNEPRCGPNQSSYYCIADFSLCLCEAKSGLVSNENDPMPKLVVNSSAEPKPLALLASSGTCHFFNAFIQAAVVLVPVGVMLMRTDDVGIQFINI
uniref:Uncharacterized protein n=1 Tax=Globodera rostochiensis TaxID=31243 RepID=A0A914I3J6_GLORO